VARHLPGPAARERLRDDHDRAREGRRVLLRRAVPPAVPREEPERVLRARRHGRLLPRRARRGSEARLASAAPAADNRAVATVAEHMSRELVRIEPEANLEEAARRMASHRVGSALVFEDDRLVGILTERDILRAVAD